MTGETVADQYTRQYQLGIDIGGTFSDAVLTDDRGGVWTFKVPSTPSDPGVGFVDAVDAAQREVPFGAGPDRRKDRPRRPGRDGGLSRSARNRPPDPA
jgi:hypothetical protein